VLDKILEVDIDNAELTFTCQIDDSGIGANDKTLAKQICWMLVFDYVIYG